MNTMNAIRASGLRVIFFDDDQRTTICDGCGCEIALDEANYAGPELPLWEGATLCNECYARERDALPSRFRAARGRGRRGP